MPTVVGTPAPYPPPAHKLWTRAECERLVETHLLDPDRYELIGGDLVLKVSKSYPHMVSLLRLIA
ncbi:MAG: hypothetical protein FJW30_22155 [Acidobacteria bacterium]|nr:hypothetical protein [Acidobacteriota bacterium]